MSVRAKARQASQHVEWLKKQVEGAEFPSTARSKAASACWGITLDHHEGIVLLSNARLFAPAFALVRVGFEAYVRGAWLWHCADETQISRFLSGKEPPKFGDLLDAIELCEEFSGKELSTVKSQRWSAMCAFTHSGGLHVQRWTGESAVAPDYGDEEILSVLGFAETLGCLAALGVATISSNDPLLDLLVSKFKSWQAHV